MATLQNSDHTLLLLTLQRRHGRQLDVAFALQVIPSMPSSSKQVNVHARSLVLTSARLYINEAHLWSDFTPSRLRVLSPTAPHSLFVCFFFSFFFFFSFGEDSLSLGSFQKCFPCFQAQHGTLWDQVQRGHGGFTSERGDIDSSSRSTVILAWYTDEM